LPLNEMIMGRLRIVEVSAGLWVVMKPRFPGPHWFRQWSSKTNNHVHCGVSVGEK
jgi:hypothetical protein